MMSFSKDINNDDYDERCARSFFAKEKLDTKE